jgi:formyl-CoA transferase
MSNKGPFEKLRVLDLARTLAGSYAATILANLGAEVITIEQPGRMSKSAGLPGRLAGGVNAAYNNFVYNKKCIAMDMRKERGKDIFYRLVEKTDILVENYRPEVSRALGLDYETLHKINPRIISCSITGYGSEGPYSNLLAWDAAGQAVSGIMSLTGEHNGGPCVVGAPIIDVGTGMNAALGIMAALYYRDRVGEGQRVEVSLIETGLGFLSWFPTYYSAGGKFPNPEGSSFPLLPVNNMQSLLTDAQVQQLNLLVDMISVEGKPIKIVRLPFRMSKFPDVRYRPISKVGEHTEEVLRELAKITPQEMEALRQEKVIDF